jgi:hypothetical protein
MKNWLAVGPGGEAPVTLTTIAEMAAHRGAGGIGLAFADGVEDGAMLVLNHRQVSVLVGGAASGDADALARDDETPDIFEKAEELRIAGGRGDGAMEREILITRRAPSRRRWP